MNVFGKDLSKEVLLVAEIGVNHEGDLNAAKEMIKLAHEAGADAVKIQSYTPERYASASDPERLLRVTKFAFSREQHDELFSFSADIGCKLFSTPLTEDWVEYLSRKAGVLKIASGDLTFEPTIKAAARSGKPVFMSTGASNEAEITQAVKWFSSELNGSSLANRLILMHCVSAYPAPLNELNIKSVAFLIEKFGITVGYSHHCLEEEPVLAALSLGARAIEVHFTSSRDNRVFRDHLLSFLPNELTRLKKRMTLTMASLGEKSKTVQPSEAALVLAIRKGLVAAKKVQMGHILTENDITYARPSNEFTSNELPQVLGRRTNKSIGKGELIRRLDLAP